MKPMKPSRHSVAAGLLMFVATIAAVPSSPLSAQAWPAAAEDAGRIAEPARRSAAPEVPANVAPAGVSSSCQIGTWQAAAPAGVARSRAGLTYASLDGRFYLVGGESVGGNRMLPIEAYDPVSNTWTPRAQLATGVSNTGVAALGQYLYVPGGWDGVVSLALLQRYNMVANSVSVLASMPTPGSGHSVVALNNRIHVLGGGDTGGVPGTAHQIYNVASNTWEGGAPLPIAVQYAAGATDGTYVFVIGGNTTNIATVQRYNPASDTWTAILDLGTGRGGPAGFFDGRQVWVAGGGWSTYLASTEFWNGIEWQTGPSMLTGGRTAGAAFGSGIALRATGWFGNYDASAELLPIQCPPPPPPPQCTMGSWATTGPLLHPRSRTGLAYSAANGRFYAAGGESTGGNRDLPIEEFNPGTGVWTPRANLLIGVSNTGVAALGQYIYVPGGFTGAVGLADMQRYDPQSNTVNTVAPMPLANHAHATVAHGSRIHVLGGSQGGMAGFTHYIYDVGSNTWSSGAPLLTAVQYPAAASDGRYVYVMGGNTENLITVQRYDPASNIWTAAPIMDAGRGGAGAFHDGRNVWAVGGGWSTYNSGTEYFDGYRWRLGPTMNVGTRTPGAAFGNGLAVRAGGWNGSYVGGAEILEISCLADLIFYNGYQPGS